MSSTSLTLLADDGTTSAVPLRTATVHAKPRAPLTSRIAYAAAHVVPVTSADNTPGQPAQIDWDATLDIRRSIYSWGLGVADAMDTAQRNMGLDKDAIRALIARSAVVARDEGGSLVVGVNTDEVADAVISLDEIVSAYVDQLHYAEEHGADAVLMASRHLARAATSADDYRSVYRAVLAAAERPVVLHWLGSAFDPHLEGYFGSANWREAADVVVSIIEEHEDRVAGIKMSLLDADAEVAVRDRLPASVRMFTGDDFHYVDLIGGADLPNAPGTGGGRGHSDALLGAFAAITPAASAAIQALDAGDGAEFERILRPTEALSRQVFGAPTPAYKTGIAFLAWLDGRQSAFQMVGGMHAARSLPHLSRIVELANEAGTFEDPDRARSRWQALLELNGVSA